MFQHLSSLLGLHCFSLLILLHLSQTLLAQESSTGSSPTLQPKQSSPSIDLSRFLGKSVSGRPVSLPEDQIKNLDLSMDATPNGQPKRFNALSERTPDDVKASQQEWAEHLKCDVEVENSLGIKMRLIPPGDFYFGQLDAAKKNNSRNRVRLSNPFYMSTCEITYFQWLKLMDGRTDSTGLVMHDEKSNITIEAKDLPMVSITWSKAMTFCEELSKLEGKRYRLPTVAEWEYACRAGTLTDYHFGKTLEPDQANFGIRSSKTSTGSKFPFPMACEVGSFPANAFGLHDMHGNVSEWCLDSLRPNHSLTDDYFNLLVNPMNLSDDVKITRGGSFRHEATDCSVAGIHSLRLSANLSEFGFRIVCETIPQQSARENRAESSNAK